MQNKPIKLIPRTTTQTTTTTTKKVNKGSTTDIGKEEFATLKPENSETNEEHPKILNGLGEGLYKFAKNISYFFTDPEEYKGPVVAGWPPSKSRNMSLYIRENENTLLSGNNKLNK